VNKVRIRDTIGEDLNIFEIHKLEDIKCGISMMREASSGDTKSVVAMRLECLSEDEKEVWVRAINSEIKQLRHMAKTLSSQFLLMS
jgi:hypothetical protein